MSLNLIDVLAVIVSLIIPFGAIIAAVIYVVRKLNLIEKKLNKLEKIIYENNIKAD